MSIPAAEQTSPSLWGAGEDARGVLASAPTAAIGSAGILIGYARCSTERQDLAAQRQILRGLGVSDDRLYLDHGLTGTNRARP